VHKPRFQGHRLHEKFRCQVGQKESKPVFAWAEVSMSSKWNHTSDESLENSLKKWSKVNWLESLMLRQCQDCQTEQATASSFNQLQDTPQRPTSKDIVQQL